MPGLRACAVVERVGTPLTHARFLGGRHRGTYGPAIRAGGPGGGGAAFPAPGTPVPGLTLCGDATFPGIGVPAVAASGLIAAHTALGLETLGPHLGLLARLEARPRRA